MSLQRCMELNTKDEPYIYTRGAQQIEFPLSMPNHLCFIAMLIFFMIMLKSIMRQLFGAILSSISVSVLEYLHLGSVVHMWPGAPDVAHRVSEELLCGNHPSYVAGPLYCCVETIPPMWRANNLFHIVQASRFFHLDLCARCHNLFLYPVFLLVGKQSKLWHA